MMKIGDDFKKFAKSEGISSLNLDRYENALTPYILEERELRATQIDIFSRLMRDRILFITGVVNQQMSDIVQAQLLYLDSVEKKDIKFYINSPGGSVPHGLGIIDLMKYISSDIATTNIGICASMGSLLLSCGTKGKRSSLVHSKVMVHQLSSSQGGHIHDNRISQIEAEKYNYILFKILGENCGKTLEEVLDGARRDKWFNSDEALEFGLIDEVIGIDKNHSISKIMDGFDKYYDKEVLNKS